MTLDKRTVVLGVAAVAAVAAAVTVTEINRHSHGSPQRRAVSAYVDRVNAIQNDMHAPLTRVLLAYRAFTSKGGASRNPSSGLAAAALTLARLDRRLAAEPAPPEARKLRRLLVSLVAQQAAITREVQHMAAFTPRYARALARARVASATLGRALRTIPVPKAHTLRGTKKAVLRAQKRYQAAAAAAATAQADAVDTYDAAITAVIRTLRTLRPPLVLTPTYRAQLQALNDVVRAGARLSAGLRKRNRKDVPALGRAFTLASREAQSVAAQRAQIEAIRAYDKRARAIGAAAGAVQQELLRLQHDLP